MLGGCPLAGSRFLVSSAAFNSEKYTISKEGVLNVGRLVLVIRPANALLIYSGDDYFGIPIRGRSLDPSEYSYPFEYYEDFDYGRKREPDYFIVELLLHAVDEHVTLDLAKMVLVANGKKTNASSYYVLEKRYSGFSSIGGKLSYITPACKAPGDQAWSASNALKRVAENRITTPLRLSEKRDHCLAVKFEAAPPDPQRYFSIKMDGLVVNGNAISLPAIQFAPDVVYRRSS